MGIRNGGWKGVRRECAPVAEVVRYVGEGGGVPVEKRGAVVQSRAFAHM